MIVQRSLFQLDVYPRKFVHPSTWGGAGGTSPPCGVRGGRSPLMGGPGARGPSAGVSRVVPLKLKIDLKFPCKSIAIYGQSRSFIRQMI